MIGPIPIIFGSDVTTLKPIMSLAVVLMVLGRALIPELCLKPSIEVLDAPVHPGTLRINENHFNTNVQAESTQVFKVPVHPAIEL